MDFQISFRPFRVSDAEFVNQLRQIDDMEQLIAGPKRPVAYERDVKWIENIILSDNQNYFYFAITQKENNDIIGYFSISEIDYRNGTCCFSGIKISPEYSGKGYGTQTVLKSLIFIFEEMRMVRCKSEVLDSNQASLKMFVNAGFQKEGLLRSSVYKNGIHADQWLLSIIKNDYEAIKLKYSL